MELFHPAHLLPVVGILTGEASDDEFCAIIRGSHLETLMVFFLDIGLPAQTTALYLLLCLLRRALVMGGLD